MLWFLANKHKRYDTLIDFKPNVYVSIPMAIIIVSMSDAVPLSFLCGVCCVTHAL